MREKQIGVTWYSKRARGPPPPPPPPHCPVYTPFNTTITILPPVFIYIQPVLQYMDSRHHQTIPAVGSCLRYTIHCTRRKCHFPDSKQLNWSFHSFPFFFFLNGRIFFLGGTMWTPIGDRKSQKKGRNLQLWGIKSQIKTIKEINTTIKNVFSVDLNSMRNAMNDSQYRKSITESPTAFGSASRNSWTNKQAGICVPVTWFNLIIICHRFHPITGAAAAEQTHLRNLSNYATCYPRNCKRCNQNYQIIPCPTREDKRAAGAEFWKPRR